MHIIMSAFFVWALAIAMSLHLPLSNQFEIGTRPQAFSSASIHWSVTDWFEPSYVLIPDGEWQEQHPDCQLFIGDLTTTPPQVIVTGSDCFPDVGTSQLGFLLIEGAEHQQNGCYRITASGGLVIVDLIDPF